MKLCRRRPVWQIALARLSLAMAALLLPVAAATAQLPTTQLTSIFPPGGKAGATVNVTLGGNDLEDVERLLFNHPGITAAAKMAEPTEFEPAAKPVPNEFVVTIAADVPAGIYEAVAVGRFGTSNPRRFVVGTLEEAIDAGGNTSPDKAIPLALNTTLNGRVDANTYEHLKLHLKQGERVLVDCQAARIDSRLDATLVVLDAGGRELARVRDTVGVDPVLDLTAPAEGDYVLKLFDLVYGGGAEHFYRLTVSPSPLVDFVFPPSGIAGATGQFTLYGRNLPGGTPAEGVLRDGVPLVKLPVEIALPGDEPHQAGLEFSALGRLRRAWQDAIEYVHPACRNQPLPVYYAKAPVTIEQEPNAEPATATKVTLPCEIAGQFYPARDDDWFQFEAKKGELYWIECLSHQLGAECDPALTVYRVTKNDQGVEQQNEVAQADDPQDRQRDIGRDFDTSTDDPSLKFTVPEDGTYRIFLRDQFGESRSDPTNIYRLAIRPAAPDFRVLVYPDRPSAGQRDQNRTNLEALSVRKGGATVLAAAVQRRDEFEGEVTLRIEGLPDGVTCPGAVLAGSVDTAALVISAAEGAAGWSGPIRVLAVGKIGEREVTREARYAVVVWGTPNKQQSPADFRLTKTLVLGVLDKDVEPAFVQVGEDKVWETSLGGNVEIPISLTRREFKENVKLVADGLPNQIKPKDVDLNGDATSGKFELVLNQQNVKPGTYTFYMRGDTKRKYVRNPDAIPAVEAEQKQITDMIAQLTEAQKNANTAKDAAAKAAQDAAAAAKTAEQKKSETAAAAKAKTDAAAQTADAVAKAKEAAAKETENSALAEAARAAETAANEAAAAQKAAEEALAAADKALIDAQAAAKTAEEARVSAEAVAKAAEEKVKAATAYKQQIDQKVNQVKQANQPKDVNFALVSTPIKLKIHPHPFQLSATSPEAALKQGEKLELPVKLERLFGFAEDVEILFEPPQGVKGLPAQKTNLPKDQTEAKLEVAAAADAQPGEHACTVRCRGKFNNVQVETTVPVTIKIEAKE
jgi:hypothetical protein